MTDLSLTSTHQKDWLQSWISCALNIKQVYPPWGCEHTGVKCDPEKSTLQIKITHFINQQAAGWAMLWCESNHKVVQWNGCEQVRWIRVWCYMKLLLQVLYHSAYTKYNAVDNVISLDTFKSVDISNHRENLRELLGSAALHVLFGHCFSKIYFGTSNDLLAIPVVLN